MRESRLILVDISELLTSTNLLIHWAESFKGRILRSTPYHGFTPVRRRAHGPDPSTMLRVMVRYSNHEVLEGKKSSMLSTRPVRRVVSPCKVKLTGSRVTEQPPIRLKLLQHALHSRAYLSFFVGSGSTDALEDDLVFPAFSLT